MADSPTARCEPASAGLELEREFLQMWRDEATLWDVVGVESEATRADGGIPQPRKFRAHCVRRQQPLSGMRRVRRAAKLRGEDRRCELEILNGALFGRPGSVPPHAPNIDLRA